MKKSFLFLLNLSLLTSAIIAQERWSEPIEIATGECPDFDIDRKTGYLHIVTVQKRVGVTYTVTDSLGSIISQEEVPNSSGDKGGLKFGPSIAVDQDGYPHICYKNFRGDDYYDIYYTRKDSSGWSNRLLIVKREKRAYMVRMAIDSENRVHIARSVLKKLPAGTVIYHRIVNGEVDIIHTGLEPYRVDNSLEIDVDNNGYIHIVLGDPERRKGDITYFRSVNGGVTIEKVGNIRSETCENRNASPDVFADYSGGVHFCYGSSIDQSVGGKPSIQYVRFQGATTVISKAVTKEGDLNIWKDGDGWGIGSVAASDNGEYIVIAYLSRDIGDLKTIFSLNGGIVWSEPETLATSVGGFESRSKQIIRAYRNHFYLIYPVYKYKIEDRKVYLIIMSDPEDYIPVASAGGPYSGIEGSSILFDGSASSDEGYNKGINKYEWDFENDGIYDFSSTSPTASYDFLDDFDGECVLRIVDRGGNAGYDTTSIQVLNVVPSVEIGENISSYEGDTVLFSSEVSDVGVLDSHTVIWDFGDGLSGMGTDVNHIFWNNGSYSVIVTVTDDDGGIGKDSLEVTVSNLSPTADAGGPYSGVFGKPINFFGSATDPGKYDVLTYTWDLDGDGVFESIGQNVSGSFQTLEESMIWLRVEDGDEGFSIDSAVVNVSNKYPVVNAISSQTIEEGGSFTPILLDNFVKDDDHNDDELNWKFSGNTDLIITLENRILTAAVPDTEWSGQETLTLIVSDPVGFEDTTEVTFTVNPVNDPPVWIGVPDYKFDEDDTLEISFSALWPFVSDIDDDTTDFRFWVTTNGSIQNIVDSVSKKIYLYAPPDWYGKEKVIFFVSDKSGAVDKDTSEIKVEGTPDSPSPFSLINPNYEFDEWPDTVRFQWHKASDPDSGEFIFYEWIMVLQGSDFKIRKPTMEDTTFLFVPDENLEHGVYLWWVKAIGYGKDVDMKSKTTGIIMVGETGIVSKDELLPTKFRLLPNYPNPFNPETKITYHIPKDTYVHLSVFNTLGQEVSVLMDGQKNPGVHVAVWNGRDQRGHEAPTGIYVCRLEAGSKVFYQKMMLIQ